MEILLSLRNTGKILNTLRSMGEVFTNGRNFLTVPLIKEHGIFLIPTAIRPLMTGENDPTFVIEACEEGGRFNGSPVGSAIVVGGISGKPLRFFRRERRVAAHQAIFRVPWGITLGKLDADLCGTRHEIVLTKCQVRTEPNKNFVWFNEKEIWRGGEDYFPPYLSPYLGMVKALREKARCYRCGCVHFSEKN